jgi:hypothetical protein
MKIRDRIKGLRRIVARELKPNPRNWRTHPQAQRDALRGVLAEIGYADALLARELADGSLELIDGHLRAETTPDVEVPVLVLDLNDEEAAKLLALHDPLAEMAEADDGLLAELVKSIRTESEAVQAVLDGILSASWPELEDAPEAGAPAEVEIPEVYRVVVECRDEDDQRAVYERLTSEGLKCRLSML